MGFGIASGAGQFEFMKDAAFPKLPYAGAERLIRIHNTSPDSSAVEPTLRVQSPSRSTMPRMMRSAPSGHGSAPASSARRSRCC
jgi:hypothetical protein